MTTHILGIRHHGPGSAASLVKALQTLKPQKILIEGPSDANDLLHFVMDEDMQPPVALLIYKEKDPAHCVYYPFTVFSPEWQAMLYGYQNNIAVQFMDLPVSFMFSLENQKAVINEVENIEQEQAAPLYQDPLSYLAQAAGFNDGERWWEQMVEERQDGVEIFGGILEAMLALREELGDCPGIVDEYEIKRQALREAYMRKVIREAEKEFETIVVVCGAWHGPALYNRPDIKTDTSLLKGLKKTKVAITWTPWTHGRLLFKSGYGAGIHSPGWYEHLWHYHTNIASHWLTTTAQVLRQQGFDISSAHIIEAVRLSETLAALRNRSAPGLQEFQEATQTVMLFGDNFPMQFVYNQLIVGERLGQVPEGAPTTPLQQDLIYQQKKLRFKIELEAKSITLDLRKPNDLEKSYLLRRLTLLGIAWAKGGYRGEGRGTFKELWEIQWQPEFMVQLIEAGIWGNTIMEAASNKTLKQVVGQPLPILSKYLHEVLYANLPGVVRKLLDLLAQEAAIASDINHLMEAIPFLANLLRYGDVRNTETGMVSEVINGLVSRICVGLLPACSHLNEEASENMFEQIQNMHNALVLLENQNWLQEWYQVLIKISQHNNLQGILLGRSNRLLLDSGKITLEEAAKRLSYALSQANDPHSAVSWADGFLRNSGQILLHDEDLFDLIDAWIVHLPEETFIMMLPLLRRTFSSFEEGERRALGEKVKVGKKTFEIKQEDFNATQAEKILPIIYQYLDI